MVDNRNIAIIPARGGSKRIPKKNIVDFMGKPMLAWTIEAALESGLFKRVLVSTDCEEIAETAKKYGADVPFLRDNCNDDYSPISLATITALNQVKNILNEDYDTVIQLMPNCPMRNSKQIINAYRNFVDNKADFQISCFKFGWMNPWWAVKLDEKSSPESIFHDAAKKRSQDLEDLYCPTGAIWIANVEKLKLEKTFYGQSHIFYPMDWKYAVDIDNPEDLEMAKAIYLLKKNKNA